MPLSQTFTGQDVRVANAYSKAVLRAVATDVVSRYNFCDYFPSFEAVQRLSPEEAYEADGIHVRAAVVAAIVDHFIAGYAQCSEKITACNLVARNQHMD